jgi:SNF2 family DNA or RNA helicase
MRMRIQELAESADIIVTTYAMLKDDKTTFNRIKWDRVVLDEMQEIRSSTTDHARACEKLLCDCRWMVSGTPLYTSIDDLNGELAFLGVLPFCASDQSDGFWSMHVSKPFQRRKPEALQQLNCLLKGIMIRHSKSQTYVDGASILDLPESSTRRVPVEMTDSEKYLYQCKFRGVMLGVCFRVLAPL